MRAQGPAKVATLVQFGDEIDTRGSLAAERGTGDPVPGPARAAGLFRQQCQEALAVAFIADPMATEAIERGMDLHQRNGRGVPCRRQATGLGRERGWRTGTSGTSMRLAGSSLPARSEAQHASRRVWQARCCPVGGREFGREL